MSGERLDVAAIEADLDRRVPALDLLDRDHCRALLAEVRRLTDALWDARAARHRSARAGWDTLRRAERAEAALAEVRALADEYRSSIDALALDGRDANVAVVEVERRLRAILDRHQGGEA